ncbi:MAG: hypothetical protein DMG91_00535 [Acidobacteria bacterium]|jgi:cytochrome c oxidase subunit 4|nr:MAG: hypothetical protein DMG91_00535 [Acidobacteriota bacterium]
MSEHIIPTRTYYLIWISLMCLTVITAAVAFVDLGQFNTIVALSIATLKALLVVLFFMHLKYTNEKMSKVAVISALFWLVLLLALSLTDYGWRGAGAV